MKSVGEAMAIGRTFRESFAKALRSRELDSAAQIPEDTAELLDRLITPAADRYDLILAAFRRGTDPDAIRERTSIDPWLRSSGAARERGRGRDRQRGQAR
jgi:carbamoyl-phosphate synthase large subunit